MKSQWCPDNDDGKGCHVHAMLQLQMHHPQNYGSAVWEFQGKLNIAIAVINSFTDKGSGGHDKTDARTF